MAWLSVGTSNDDLCDKMVLNGVLEDGKILNAFRSVDRGDFVPPEDRLQAYHDRPFKRGSIHISAPHMYVTVLDALDLKPGNAFLNVGSGSGYLCCLAWCLLGEHGLSHGVEINPQAVEFSRRSIARFHDKRNEMLQGKFDCEPVMIVEGNCFDIDIHSSMMQCRYDRIYVGAGCPEARKQFFYDLLADGGILVLPINERNQMIKVTKIAGNIFSVKHVSNVHFAPLIDVDDDHDLPPAAPVLPLSPTAVESQILNMQVESLFIFQRSATYAASSSTASSPSANASAVLHPPKIHLPTLVWAPVKTRHRQYPFEFRQMVKLILIASNQCDYSRLPMRSVPKCLCSLLPTHIWYHILSYASRDWFVPQKSEVELLRMELITERRLRRQAEEQLQLAEQAKRVAERERDLFRAVMMRLGPNRVKAATLAQHLGSVNHHLDLDDEEEDEEEESEDEEEGEEEEAVEMVQDHDEDEEDDDEEEEEEEEEVSDEEDGDESVDDEFEDAVDLPEPVSVSILLSNESTMTSTATTTMTSMELSPIAHRSTGNHEAEVSTSFGSNTTHESMMAEAMEEDDEGEEAEHDTSRSSFFSTSSSRESSVTDGEEGGRSSLFDADAVEHFESDL